MHKQKQDSRQLFLTAVLPRAFLLNAGGFLESVRGVWVTSAQHYSDASLSV